MIIFLIFQTITLKKKKTKLNCCFENLIIDKK